MCFENQTTWRIGGMLDGTECEWQLKNSDRDIAITDFQLFVSLAIMM